MKHDIMVFRFSTLSSSVYTDTDTKKISKKINQRFLNQKRFFMSRLGSGKQTFFFMAWSPISTNQKIPCHLILPSSVHVKIGLKSRPIVSNKLYRFENTKTWHVVFVEVCDDIDTYIDLSVLRSFLITFR
jgi:hypothetical protein